MSTTLSIAASGMVAAQTRLEVTAHNVANASASQIPDVAQAFAALRVDQVAVAGGGTAAHVSRPEPAPSLPAPSVELANQMAEMVIARYTFAANANVMRIAAQMEKELINKTV